MAVVACTGCENRFEAAGYRDVMCPACGAVAQPPAVRPCPRCDLPLHARLVSDLVLDECGRCWGLFLDRLAKRLLAEHNVDRAEALFAALANGPEPSGPPADKPQLACPVCQSAMQRKLSATGAGVVIDICKSHGTFFDGGELHKLLAFARRQALEQAAVRREDPHEDERQEPHDPARTAVAMLALGGAAALTLVGGPVASLFVNALLGAAASSGRD